MYVTATNQKGAPIFEFQVPVARSGCHQGHRPPLVPTPPTPSHGEKEWSPLPRADLSHGHGHGHGTRAGHGCRCLQHGPPAAAAACRESRHQSPHRLRAARESAGLLRSPAAEAAAARRRDHGTGGGGRGAVVHLAGRRHLLLQHRHRHAPLRAPGGVVRRVPPGPPPRVPRHVPRREPEPAAQRRGVEDPYAAPGVPPHHRAPRRRDAVAQPRRRRARPPNHRVGAEGAGQRLHAGELRPGRAGVAVRGQGPAARQPAEGPPRDLHHRRPPAAPADRAGGRPPGRRRVGPVDACREDEAGRGRRPRRRLPEVPAGEGGVQSGGDESRQQSLKARVFFLLTVELGIVFVRSCHVACDTYICVPVYRV